MTAIRGLQPPEHAVLVSAGLPWQRDAQDQSEGFRARLRQSLKLFPLSSLLISSQKYVFYLSSNNSAESTSERCFCAANFFAAEVSLEIGRHILGIQQRTHTILLCNSQSSVH